MLTPHTDHCKKVLSILFYMPYDDDARTQRSGTAMYRPMKRAPKDMKCMATMPDFTGFKETLRASYASNVMFAFAPCKGSWHGVPPSKTHRRQLFLWLRFVNASRYTLGPCQTRQPASSKRPPA